MSKFKKCSVLLFPEQVQFLKDNGGICKGVRNAVYQAMKKHRYHLTFTRYTHSGWFEIIVKARDETDLINQINAIQRQLVHRLNQADDWCDWYVYEVKQLE